MQSSPKTALRTMVLLSSLVVVPLAAVFGSSLQTVVQTAIGGTLWSADPENASIPEDSVAEPNLEAERRPAATRPPARSNSSMPVVRYPKSATPRVRADARVASRGQARGANSPNYSFWGGREGRESSANLAEMAHRQVGYERRRGENSSSDPDAIDATHASYADAEPRTATDEAAEAVQSAQEPAARSFSDVQRQLHALGATYMRLETWGEDQELYRFQCHVLLAAGSRRTRHFESTDSDPDLAIERVLKQVVSWRQPRVPGRVVTGDRDRRVR